MNRLVFLLFIGASAGLAFPAGAADLSTADLATARRIYTTKCAKCHKLYEPSRYTNEEWDVWMRKMVKKSKLKPDQSDLVLRYAQTLKTADKPPVSK